mmetsp:Transcript_14755/g.44418  ORF Transcript_14755/g.44418 Transcript_14755/m.44418 type:complete len:205 (+) Transcript_14755:268-882(+)
MNLTEHSLDEVEVEQWRMKEMLSAILHTILFVRAPGPVRPTEATLDRFDKAYATCGTEDIDRAVDESIDGLMTSLEPAGPELGKGCMVLSFFEKRVTAQLFGLVSNEEKVVWEQWRIPVLISVTPRPMGDDTASVIERQRQAQQADAMLQARIMQVFSLANGHFDHLPPVHYEFEISCGRKGAGEKREAVYARMMQAPPLINLS